jgi:hypothetical protein
LKPRIINFFSEQGSCSPRELQDPRHLPLKPPMPSWLETLNPKLTIAH